MTVRYNYIFPIPESDDVFDEMVRDGCSIEWNDPMTQKMGGVGNLRMDWMFLVIPMDQVAVAGGRNLNSEPKGSNCVREKSMMK